MWQLKLIAAALGVTAEITSAEDTRTIIEGKLQEICKDPSKVQVVVEDLDDNSDMLLNQVQAGVCLVS